MKEHPRRSKPEVNVFYLRIMIGPGVNRESNKGADLGDELVLVSVRRWERRQLLLQIECVVLVRRSGFFGRCLEMGLSVVISGA